MNTGFERERKNKLRFRVNFADAPDFRRELIGGVLIFALVITWGTWPIMSAPNSSYPVTVDGMGHLTRIEYLADCLKELKWPSWFPYWYNGSTVVQYYPPFSFLSMAVVQIIFDNIMITYKCLLFFSQFIGALGVWFLCCRYIGARIGIIGGVLYALQPYLLRTLLVSGALAQGPIFALSPWLLFFSLWLFEKRNAASWLLVCAAAMLLILSHPMHAYLVCMCMGVAVLLLLAQRRIAFSDFTLWIMAVALGAGAGAFWSLPGVTHLENPGIPYLLPEACAIYAARWSWFNPAFRYTGQFYISLSLLPVALTSAFLVRKNKTGSLIIALLASLVASVCLSFGYYFPLFKYIPMHQSLVAGRFLSYSALAATILSMFVLKEITNRIKSSDNYLKLVLAVGLSAISFLVVLDINPQAIPVKTDYYLNLQKKLEIIAQNRSSFAQGRFTWVFPTNSEITYFPMRYGLNMADGWNIEGTPHNRTIWQHNIAIPNGCYDYVVRNLLYWNVRSAFISKQYAGVEGGLLEHGFKIIGSDSEKNILYSPVPSSYFLQQKRNALVIGKAAINLEMHFPWFIRGYSASLEDYPLDYLNRFKLVYIIDPEVKDFNKFQNVIADLAGAGKMVIIEMGRSEIWPVDDVYHYWEKILPGSKLVPVGSSPFLKEISLDPDPQGQVPAVGNLDEVWMEMQVGERRIPVLGYKSINGNPVYFVGLALGQQLASEYGGEIKVLLEQLMDQVEPYKSIRPVAFPVEEAVWRHDGFSFEYYAEKETPVQISVTYTPRWRATVDGHPLQVYNLENLTLIDLPAGEHRVSFHYGMTWVGQLGIGLSVISLLLVMSICYKFDRIDQLFCSLQNKMKNTIETIGT